MTTKTWIDGNGNWNTAADWNTGTVPAPGDDAVIPNGFVQLTTSVSVASITLGGGNQTGLLIANPGGTDTVTGDFSNNGSFYIDTPETGSSGSTLTIGGALINNIGGNLFIGYHNPSADAIVTAFSLSNSSQMFLTGSTIEIAADFLNNGLVAMQGGDLDVGGALINNDRLFVSAPQTTATLRAAGFSNSGSFALFGGDSFGNTGHATATFGGSAPSTLTGRIGLAGDASMQFTGGGTINSIANDALLSFETWRGSQPSPAGLSGLTSNAGTLAFDTGRNPGYYGGMNLTFGNTITNTGTIAFGGISRLSYGSDTVTMAGLNNSGRLIMGPAGPGDVILNVLGPAPSTLTGDNLIAAHAVLQYGSGSITAIGSGAVLDLYGSGRIGLNGQAGNSALTHLAGNAGGLHMTDGFDNLLGALTDTIATDTDFSNTNFVQIDRGVLALGGALNNSAIFQIRGGTVSAANVNNAGTLALNVESPGHYVAPPPGGGTLAITSGGAFNQSAGSTTVSHGTLTADRVNIAGGSLVFQTPLTSAAHTGPITVSGGSFVQFWTAVDSAEQVGFGGPGIIRLDIGSQFAGTIFHFTNSGEAVAITDLSDANNDAHTSFNPATNQLTVFGDNGSVTLQLDAENYSGVSWSTQQDGTGGTFVSASFVAGSQYVFFAPGQPVNIATTTDPKNVPPPVPGDFNIEIVVNASGTGRDTTAPGYQGLAVRSTDGHTLTLLHGDYGAVDTGAGNTVFLGDDSESIGGAIGDTILGGSGPNQFLDGHAGNESILGGNAGNETIWTAVGDTIRGGSGNTTIGGVAGVTMIGGNGGNEFFDASQGHQSVLGGSGGNQTIWGGTGDTIQGGSRGNETIAGVSGETIVGGAANTFFDATSGNESIFAGGGNSTVWSGPQDTVQGMSGGDALIGFAGGNETVWDDGATAGRHDSISTFNQPAGDRVSLNSATDTPSGVAGTAVTDGSGNTTVTFSDGSMLTFIGISSINSSYFTTH